MKKVRIAVQVDKKDYEIILNKANQLGLSLSAYIRSILKKLKE